MQIRSLFLFVVGLLQLQLSAPDPTQATAGQVEQQSEHGGQDDGRQGQAQLLPLSLDNSTDEQGAQKALNHSARGIHAVALRGKLCSSLLKRD